MALCFSLAFAHLSWYIVIVSSSRTAIGTLKSVCQYIPPYNITPFLPRIFFVSPSSVDYKSSSPTHKIFPFIFFKYPLSELSELPTNLGLSFTHLPFCVSFPLFRSARLFPCKTKWVLLFTRFSSSFHLIVVLAQFSSLQHLKTYPLLIWYVPTLLIFSIMFFLSICFPSGLVKIKQFGTSAFIYNFFSKRQDAPKVRLLTVATHTSFMEWK